MEHDSRRGLATDLADKRGRSTRKDRPICEEIRILSEALCKGNLRHLREIVAGAAHVNAIFKLIPHWRAPAARQQGAIPLNREREHTFMKMKDLRKKIRRLERRLREGPQKLAVLKRSLEIAEAVKALKAARKSAARSAAARIAEAKKSSARKAKRKLNLSPERRAQLAAAMKARWAAKRAAEANAVK